MAQAAAPLEEVVALIAGEMVAEVCSVYVMRPGGMLELAATCGLKQEAVGHTRLRLGEGIVGLVAATGQPLNLPDAQNHPAFVYRPETGEEIYASMLAVPVRRAGRTLGVVTVQNRLPRRYDDIEVETVETVAMLLAESLAASGQVAADDEALAATLPRRFVASVLSPGLAMGPVVRLGALAPPRQLLADDPAAEIRRLRQAAEAMQRGLDDLLAARAPEGNVPREVLEAYRLIAADAGWLRRAIDAVQGGLSAEAAVHRVVEQLRERMRWAPDPYLRERLADLEDMAGRLLLALAGSRDQRAVLAGAILLARRLGAAELLEWHARGIAGVVVEEASPVGHAAILARALGLPALGGARGILAAAEDGEQVVVDADHGLALLRPEAELNEIYARALVQRSARQEEWKDLRRRPGRTADGVSIRLMLNAGLAIDLAQLDATGAEGIGLYRTEIGVLAHGEVAGMAEQAAAYARVLDVAGERPVIFRTFDLGGDKVLSGTETPEEQNPAMGWRSLRVGLDRPAVLRRQLHALLVAARGRVLSVMFPMVATVAEFCAARAILSAEAEQVTPAPERLEVGCMVEVPSLLWQLKPLLAETDFISVGSNDLLQFLFAADRTSPLMAGRYDLLSGPAFDVLEQLVQAAGAAGKPISLCGEAASRPLEALALAGIGLTTLSMSAGAILPVKAMFTALDLGAFRPVLAAIRRGAASGASFRETLAAWAREQDLPL